MGTLILGLVIFFAVHSVSIVNRAFRDRMVETLGEIPWKGVYTLLSVVGVVLIVWGYGAARLEPTVLYVPPLWLRHIALVLLLPVFPLFVATYLPSRIGVAAKHPTLLATKLWALAHLLANGMLADVLLFGAFLAWAVADRIAVKRRAVTREVTAPATFTNDVIVVVVGLAVYVAFLLWVHTWLIGVPPIAL